MDNETNLIAFKVSTESEAIVKSTRTSTTPYDDVFRTMLNDCKQLLLPVLNEVFGEHYTGNERIVHSKNEHLLNRQDTQEKRITDSAFTVIGKTAKSFLFECQSQTDNSMLIRIFEYETQIALDEGIIIGDTLEVTIPNSAVLYLRSNNSTPDKMQVRIHTPCGSVAYDVLVIKVKNYSLKELFEKDLLFLLPFYIFNYGSQEQLEELQANSQKLADLEREYETIVKRLNELAEQEIISAYYRIIILEMSRKVVDNLAARYEKVSEGVKAIMGGTILNYPAKDYFNAGAMEEKKETALTLQEMGMAIDQIALAVRVSITQVEEWLGMSLE